MSGRVGMLLRRAASLAAFVLGLWLSWSVAEAQDVAQPHLKTLPLVITTATGEHRLTVEMALSMEEKTRGLMFRDKLADDEGMLFDFGRDDQVMMWMKNTLLSLDMVFIRADGVVASVAERAQPLSTDIIPSRAIVRAVLEVPAGTARRLGIRPGDKVKNLIFGNGP